MTVARLKSDSRRKSLGIGAWEVAAVVGGTALKLNISFGQDGRTRCLAHALYSCSTVSWGNGGGGEGKARVALQPALWSVISVDSEPLANHPTWAERYEHTVFAPKASG